MPQGVSFDGSGSIRMRPQGEFNLRNVDSSDNAYNIFFLKHQSNQNQAYLENYKYNDTSVLANRLGMISNNVNNVENLNNYNVNLATQTLANQILLGSYSTYQSISLKNNRLADDTLANSFEMSSGNTMNNFTLTNNKKSDPSNSANMIFAQSGSSNDGIWLYNYQFDTANYATTIALIATSTTDDFAITNYIHGTSDYANTFNMKSESGVNSVRIENYDSSGSLLNYLRMNYNSARLYAKNDLRLISGGAIRMESQGSQDIVLDADDDLSFSYVDKWHVIDNGTDRVLSFGNDGNVKWAYA